MHSLFEPGKDFFDNPYPQYQKMLATPGPFWLPHKAGADTPGIWLFSRYEEAVEILKIPAETLSKQITKVLPHIAPGPIDLTIMNMDPPQHTRLRNLASQAFTPNAIKALEPRIQVIADDLIDSMLREGGGDFISGFANSLPVTVICEMMEIPAADRAQMLRWVFTFMAAIDSMAKDEAMLANQRAALAGIVDYFAHLVRERSKSPGTDLVSTLIAAQDRSEVFSPEELLRMCAILLITGHETTVSLIGSGLHCLLHHPDQMARLRQQPDLMPSAIEEMLRYESPFQRSSFRMTTRPCTIAGKSLEAGEQVGVVIGAANRDPAEFSEPDSFDIGRTPNRHIAFGSGIHACLGATMARTEARIAFSRLLERTANIRQSGRGQWRSHGVIRALQHLPVTF